MRRSTRSAMGKAFGLDFGVIAKFVDIWRHPRNVGSGPFEEGVPQTPIALNDIAWELGIGAPKVAITMKYAEADGWVRRTTPRTEQAAWEPTEKALAQFPDGQPQVMPEPVVTELPSGARVSGLSAAEMDDMDQERGYTRLTPQKGPQRRLDGKESFKGYLPPGDDAA